MFDPRPLIELVKRARQGDPKAIRDLVEQHFRPAYSIALSIARNPQDAEDIAQDALIKAFDNIDTCRDPHRFTAWVLQIARNCARNFVAIRKEDAMEIDCFAQDLPWAADAGVGSRGHLIAALHVLTERQREIILLHDLEGWTHVEIAQNLGISETLSRQDLFVGRKKLREFLEPSTASFDATERVVHAKSAH